MSNQFTAKQISDALDLLRSASNIDNAGVIAAGAGYNNEPVILEISLDDARYNEPYNFAFTYLYVFYATDNNASATIKIGKNSIGNYPLPFKKGTKFKFEQGHEQIFITNAAQPGKKLFIFAAFKADFDLQIQQIENFISTGNAFNLKTPVAIDDGTGSPVGAKQIFAADSDCKRYIICNVGPNDCELVEQATDTYGTGIPLVVGEKFIDDGQNALFAICASGETAEIRIVKK
jgi:hypothetical protein